MSDRNTDEHTVLILEFSVLHPQFKTRYFTQENWEADWIGEAKSILHKQWETNYAPLAVDLASPPSTVSDTEFDNHHLTH